MARISSALFDNRLQELRAATGDDTLHLYGAYGKYKIHTNTHCDSRGCKSMGTGVSDALETGLVSRSQLFDCMTAAIAGISRARRIRSGIVAVALFAASLVGANAADALHGEFRDYPYIGTPAYSASCTVTQEYDDGALAYCAEDGATYYYDADGQPEYAFFPHRFAPRVAGWQIRNEAKNESMLHTAERVEVLSRAR